MKYNSDAAEACYRSEMTPTSSVYVRMQTCVSDIQMISLKINKFSISLEEK